MTAKAKVEMVPLAEYYHIGDAVEVRGRGNGFVKKITHGGRPYHVQVGDNTYVCSSAHLTRLTGEEKAFVTSAYDEYLQKNFRKFKELSLGTIVTLDDRGGLYVVTTPLKNGRLNVAKLGGDGNRYVRCGVDSVIIVDPETVLR